ncbi:transposase [Kozakia baliensis]|uniref:transposase n=1 Tax=Kozakia baliensis TaxID=153496 RepID=UPI001314B80C|nr:transposase [Kozakia baliensis]
MASIPGLETITAHAILADVPELGTMEEGQAASLAGLVPITRQSGTWRRPQFHPGRSCHAAASALHAGYRCHAVQP